MATRISNMGESGIRDVVNPTPRKTGPAPVDENSTRDLQRKPTEMNETLHNPTAGHGAALKSSTDTRIVPVKRTKPSSRENRAPLGPRPPEFTSRRVISDIPVHVTTSPRRSQIPNTTSEPFLGLSARKKPSQPPAAQVVSSRPKDPKGGAVGSHSTMNRPSTPDANLRTDLDKRAKAHVKSGPSAIARTGPSGHPSTRSRNPAVAAAQISSASASGSSVVTPLTVRTKRQIRQPSSSSDGLDISAINKIVDPDLLTTTPVDTTRAEAPASSNTRASQGQAPASIIRKSSSTKPPIQSSIATSNHETPEHNKISASAAAERARLQRLAARHHATYRLAVPSEVYEEDPKISITEQPPQKPAFVNNTKHLKDYPLNVGGLSRTISPTDARRPKHNSEVIQPVPAVQDSPSPDSLSTSKPTITSPSFPRRKSDSSSSPRVTPEGHQGFSIGQPLSSRSSYSSLRAPSSSLQHRTVSGNQPPRNTSLKSRNTHSPVADIAEIVPPVPAIPKGYGSPKVPSEEQFYFNFDNSIPLPSHSDIRGRGVAQNIAQHTSPSQDSRHKKGSTIASGFGTGNTTYNESNLRHSAQQMRSPQPNLLPLSKPTADRIDAFDQRRGHAGGERITPPLANRPNGTPSTPMTASTVRMSGRDMRFNPDTTKNPVARSLSSHHLPGSTPSGASSPGVYVTPSPAASPAPFSPVGSLAESLDVDQVQRREKERNDMLSSNKPTEPSLGEAQTKYFRHFSRDIPAKPILATKQERMVPVGSPQHRNFSHAWNAGSSRTSQVPQQFNDAVPSSASTSQDMSLAKASAIARRSVSMNPMPQVSLQSMDLQETKPRLPTITATQREAAKVNRVVSQGTNLASREASATNGQTSLVSKPSSSILAPVQKVLSSRPSLHGLKRRQSDSSTDKDEIVADEEMKKLASKRKDFEVAVKELDELRRRASAKERMSPSQAARMENLNIFERGEIIDYKDVYFCGSKTAKKFVGDLSSQAANFGFDDERGDYNLVMGDHLAFRYEVVDLLGKGSFGQVVRCVDHKTGTLVAVKIIRNKKRFHQQALVEVNILQLLREWDPNCQHSMINFTQSFYFRGHLCISTELLDMNLYEFIKAHEFRGFSLKLIRRFTKQILSSLVLLQSRNVIHCDLKPENILLSHPLRSEIKVIDFGSSCFQNEKVYTYIQSRFYRSPEVLLGMNYGMPIDMWSVGCIIAELYTGYPIFPGENELEQMACIMEVFGPPEKSLLEHCSRRKLFFDSSGKPRPTVSSKGKRRRPNAKPLQQAIKCDDEAFLDFITRCLRWDPEKRMKPEEAMTHEFITGSKKKPRVPTGPGGGAISPTKRYPTQTPSKPRPLPDLPATIAKPGSAVPGPSDSPVKGQAALRRHSTISGLPQNGGNSRLSTGVLNAPTSALPRAIPRNVSGKSDLASAAALASIVSDVKR